MVVTSKKFTVDWRDTLKLIIMIPMGNRPESTHVLDAKKEWLSTDREIRNFIKVGVELGGWNSWAEALEII